jgi:dihydroorotate dehydrogenase electron transfer subunit
LGFASAEQARLFEGDFRRALPEGVRVFTDDGGAGERGFPTEALAADIAHGARFDAILTCGPAPLMRAVKRIVTECGADGFMSGESRMGCGAGACLVCACPVRDDEGRVHYARACADGPVFDIKKAELL